MIHVLTNFVFLEMLFPLRISISFLLMLSHLLFLLFFLLLRICHLLLSGSNLESENSSRFAPLKPTRRSTRVSRTPNWYGFSFTLSTISVPTCYSQASKHECWQKAMEEELLALKENSTWDIVSCPSNVHPIGCKWVYSIKLHSN